MNCKACGKEIEESVAFCPFCGAAQQPAQSSPVTEASAIPEEDSLPPKKKSVLSILWMICKGVVVLILILAGIHSLNPDNNILGIQGMREAYAYATEVITEQLMTPSTAEFPDFEPEFVRSTSEKLEYEGYEFRIYIVEAYVDADNAFGTPIRHDFTVKIGLPIGTDDEGCYYEILDFDYLGIGD